MGKKNKRIRGTLSEQAGLLKGGASPRRHAPHSRAARSAFSGASERNLSAAPQHIKRRSQDSQRITPVRNVANQDKAMPTARSQRITAQGKVPQGKGAQSRRAHTGGFTNEAGQRKTSQLQRNQRPRARKRRPPLNRKQIEARKKYNAILLKAIIWLAIITLVIACVAFVGSTIRNSIDTIDAATAKPNPVDEYREIACTPDLIVPELTAKFTYSGKPVSFTTTLENTGKKRPCYLDAGYKEMHLVVKSGDELIWDSEACKLGDESLQLLIGAQREGTFTAQWDGKVSGASCAGTNLSQPGTYRAQMYWNKRELGEEYVFELKAEPKPEPKPEDKSAEELE